MSNYTKTTNFATKDNLSPGNPLKIVKGTEIDTEYNNIATAVATKTDNASAAITGGTIVGITDLAVADGGTGASTAANARSNLSAAASGANSDITSLTGLTTPLTIAQGGTAASTAAGARTSLGLVIGTDVLAPNGSAASLTSFPTLNQNTTGNAATVTTNANLTGDVTSVGNATTLTNAPVIAKVLTGYVSGAGTVAATDSILQAIQKLNGNDATNANLTGMVTSVGNATTVVTNANLTGGVTSVGNAATVVTNANLTGAVTSVGNATSLGSFTSAQLLGALTDETGTGSAVFATSPTLVTPILGTPTSATLTNATGLPLTSGVTGLLPIANGGTATATPSIVAGTNVTVTGTWPNQTINSTASGTGDVVGPASSTDNAFARFDLTTGKLLQNSTGATLSDTGAAIFTGALDVLGNSTAGSNLKLYEDTDNGTNFVSLKAPNTIAADVTFTLPSADGTASQFLQTNGSGTLSFATVSGSGDVVGPASSTANGIALFDGTTGKLLKNSSATDGLIHGLTVGRGAGAVSTNTVFGASAYQANTTGSNSVVVGNQAGYTNSTGIQNVFIGNQAGYAATGRDGTFVGNGAGGAITSGTNNTIIGQYDGNGDGLDIRTASNYAVISDGDGNRLLSTANGYSLALDGGAVPQTGTGITFPATQSASADANTLDDYEEGTWTPVPVPGTGSITSYTSSGSYRKIGTNVIITGVIAITNAGTGGTGITITGAPFTSLTYAYGVMKDTLGGNIYFSDIAESSTSLNPQTLTNGYLPVVTATYRFSISYIAS